MTNLCEDDRADQGDLADTEVKREKATESAIDALRDKFGDKAIVRGLLFEPRRGK